MRATTFRRALLALLLILGPLLAGCSSAAGSEISPPESKATFVIELQSLTLTVVQQKRNLTLELYCLYPTAWTTLAVQLEAQDRFVLSHKVPALGTPTACSPGDILLQTGLMMDEQDVQPGVLIVVQVEMVPAGGEPLTRKVKLTVGDDGLLAYTY